MMLGLVGCVEAQPVQQHEGQYCTCGRRRRDFRTGALEGLQELTLTTNGSQLSKYASELARLGVQRINISLDSLDPSKFKQITRTGNLEQVIEGIDAARTAGFKQIKLNFFS